MHKQWHNYFKFKTCIGPVLNNGPFKLHSYRRFESRCTLRDRSKASTSTTEGGTKFRTGLVLSQNMKLFCSYLLSLLKISYQFPRRRLFVYQREDIANLGVRKSQQGQILWKNVKPIKFGGNTLAVILSLNNWGDLNKLGSRGIYKEHYSKKGVLQIVTSVRISGLRL